MKLGIPVIAAAALALSACATPATDAAGGASADRDCFHANSVTGYTVIDDHTIGVNVGANRQYIFTTNWDARELDWTQVIAVRSTTSWICVGSGVGVDIIGGDPQRTFPVDTITRAPDQNAVEGS